jgi:hypothetical protein
MNKNKNLIILDIGSHKLEEIQTLLSPFPRQFFIYFKWLVKKILKIILRFDKNELKIFKKHIFIFKYYFIKKNRYNITIIAIEPNPEVIIPYYKKISKKYKIFFIPAAILGHDTFTSFEVKTLFGFGDTISHSLYKKSKSNNLNQNSLCIAIKLTPLWNELVNSKIIDSDSETILRINCEGAEFGVLQECKILGINLKCVIGSLGDIKKIHGIEYENFANQILNEMNIKYTYFKGDDPGTWYDLIKILDPIIKKYKI